MIIKSVGNPATNKFDPLFYVETDWHCTYTIKNVTDYFILMLLNVKLPTDLIIYLVVIQTRKNNIGRQTHFKISQNIFLIFVWTLKQ